MSELRATSPQARAPIWRVVALTAIILFMLTTGAAIQLAHKLEATTSLLQMTRAEQERERKSSAQERDRALESHRRLMSLREALWKRLRGHSYGTHPEAKVAGDPVDAGESWGRTYQELGAAACSGVMEVRPAVERGRFRQWIFNMGDEEAHRLRFRYSIEPRDSQGFLLWGSQSFLTAEILPVLTTSDQVEFFLWVSSSARPSDPFPRRLVSLGAVPRATVESESFVLVDRLGRGKPLRFGDLIPVFDVVRQSDGATVVSLTGYVEALPSIEAPRPGA